MSENSDTTKATDRKIDHLKLAASSQWVHIPIHSESSYFYEPLLGQHPCEADLNLLKTEFMGLSLGAPLWVSSMTGGAEKAAVINQRLARVCGQYQLPLALGSCRSLLSSRERWADFAVKKYLNGAPLFANFGLAQVEHYLQKGQAQSLFHVAQDLESDGLIVHVNPLQEWIQPEGDRWHRPGLEILEEFLALAPKGAKILVKEVGQGMGPKSLEKLMGLPLAAIELAGLGGTNFNLLEIQRGGQMHADWIGVGHSSQEMVGFIGHLLALKSNWACSHIIISGGIRSVLDGQALRNKLACPTLIGQAFSYLAPALESEQALKQFVHRQLMELLIVRSFLWPR